MKALWFTNGLFQRIRADTKESISQQMREHFPCVLSGKKVISNIHGSLLSIQVWFDRVIVLDSPGTKTQPFFPASPQTINLWPSGDGNWWEMIALLSCLTNCDSFVLKTQTDSPRISPFQQNWALIPLSFFFVTVYQNSGILYEVLWDGDRDGDLHEILHSKPLSWLGKVW